MIDQDDRLMYVANFEIGRTISKVAYLLDVVKKFDSNHNAFLRFRFKTADGVQIVGRKFQVDFLPDETVLQMCLLKKTLVNVEAEVSTFADSYTLLVKDVSLTKGDIDKSVFFRSYKDRREVFENINSKLIDYGCNPLSASWKDISFYGVRSGEIGGIFRILGLARDMLWKLEPTNKVIDKAFFLAIPGIIRYLTYLEKLDFVPKKALLEILTKVEEVDDSAVPIAQDVLSSFFKMAEPEHVDAHKIVGILKLLFDIDNYSTLVAAAPKFTVLNIGGRKFVNY